MTYNSDYKLSLELNKNQTGVVMAALEFYFRFGMGQTSILQLHSDFDYNNMTYEKRNQLEYILKSFQQVRFDQDMTNSYNGISSEVIHNDNRVACDIYDVMRNKVAYHHNPEGGWGVSFDEPFNHSKEPLPKCEVK